MRLYAPVIGACVGALGGYTYAMYHDWLMLYAPLWVLCLFIVSCVLAGTGIGYALSDSEAHV